MKKISFFTIIILFFFSCSHPDFKKEGGSRIVLEASIGDMLKPYIQTDDSLAQKVMNVAYENYFKQDKPFLDLYLNMLAIVDHEEQVGKHFKGIGLNPTASVAECKVYFGKKLSEAMDNVMIILQKRINEFGIYGPAVRKGDKAEQLIVELPGKNDMQRVRKLLQGSARLEFWETYENQDIFQKVSDLNKSLSKELYPEYVKDTVVAEPEPEPESKPTGTPGTLEEQLTSHKKKKQNTVAVLSHMDQQKEDLMKENPLFAILSPAVRYDGNGQASQLAPGPVVGNALAKDTSKINTYLNMPSSKRLLGRYTKFLWSLKPLENSDAYSLVAIKVRRNGAAPIYGNIIQDARVVFDNQMGVSPQISITMTRQAGWDWKDLTHDNVGKAIAIVVDNQVYSYPNVMSEIAGGVSSITGNFTKDEAADFVTILKAGYLPLPVHIVQEDVVPPFEK